MAAIALVAVVATALIIPFAATVAQAARDRLASAVERDATVIAGYAEEDLERGDPADLGSVVAAYGERTGGRVVIVDADGVAVADSQPPNGSPAAGRDFSTRSEVATALAGGIATGSRYSQTLDDGFLYVAVPSSSGSTVHGAVRISYPTAAVEARIARSRVGLAGAGALALIAAALLAVVFGRWLVAPLAATERAAGRLAAGDLTARAPEDAGPPELRRMAATLNTMAGRVDELIVSQHSFIADASHQLRTPLTALRLRLEGLELTATPDERVELMAAIEEVVRLNRLVDGLLTLVRAESARPATTPVDAAEALRERAAVWEPLATEQDVRLGVETPTTAEVLAVDGALGQVLDNLIANALRYAPPGSTITLTVGRSAGRTVLTVADEGPGMSAEQRERAFDRFWRDSTDHDEGGFGLGLAIVRRLVRASGGDVRLDEAPGGGLSVRVSLRSAATPVPV